jgi:hypothetical protein
MSGVRSTAGNEILTSATAAILTLLLAAEGFTLLSMDSLLSAHMFIGLLLVPPVLLKLASTGYRFARYYSRSPVYREKGPPQVALRLLAPVLVVTTVLVIASGVGLLLVGHRSGILMQLHKVSFVAWGVVFGIHFLAYLPRVLRSLGSDWSRAQRRLVGGARARAGLVVASVAAGAAFAVALLPTISHFHRVRF